MALVTVVVALPSISADVAMASNSVRLLAALMQNRDVPQSRYCIVGSDGWEFTADIPAKLTTAALSPVAVVSRGIPWISEECSRRWLGDRLLCFPDGIPDRRRISIVSSRLRQRLDQELWWFDLLRTLMLQSDARAETIVTVAKTTACAAAIRAAQLFGRPSLHFTLPEDCLQADSSLKEWLQTCQRPPSDVANMGIPDFCRVFVSPELPERQDFSDVRPAVDLIDHEIPLGDRILMAASSRVYVLSVRPNGVVSQVLKYHLKDAELRSRPLMLACNSKGELPSAADDLPAGWVAWLLQPFAEQSSADENESSSNSSILTLPDAALTVKPTPHTEGTASDLLCDPASWLLHWTRAKAGPWPSESQDDFLDAMLLQTESADHSALATLLRIISARRVTASSDGIRGGHAVVSFTAVSLSEFRDRRVFRKHRHRFDFEPWGIGICKAALLQLGARPVIYGTAETWLALNADERAFFQKATSDGATNNCAELEWRVIGDVDLSQLPAEAVCVFVDNVETAALVARHTLWRVLVTP